MISKVLQQNITPFWNLCAEIFTPHHCEHQGSYQRTLTPPQPEWTLLPCHPKILQNIIRLHQGEGQPGEVQLIIRAYRNSSWYLCPKTICKGRSQREYAQWCKTLKRFFVKFVTLAFTENDTSTVYPKLIWQLANAHVCVLHSSTLCISSEVTSSRGIDPRTYALSLYRGSGHNPDTLRKTKEYHNKSEAPSSGQN